MKLLGILEDLYWRWMDGPLLTCGTCGQAYRRDSVRGMCAHALAAYQERTGARP